MDTKQHDQYISTRYSTGSTSEVDIGGPVNSWPLSSDLLTLQLNCSGHA